MKKYFKSYFCHEANTELNQIIYAFVYGLLFGGFSWGIVWLIVFIIIYEIFIFYVTDGLEPHWRLLARVGINAALFLGWILGRWLILGHTGLEFLMRKC